MSQPKKQRYAEKNKEKLAKALRENLMKRKEQKKKIQVLSKEHNA